MRIYIMECSRARAWEGMDDKPLILPIEARCWDWTRSFPYPFDVITAGTILATAMAIISRDVAEISRRIFTFFRPPSLSEGFLLISFNFHCSLFARDSLMADAWIFDDVLCVNKITVVKSPLELFYVWKCEREFNVNVSFLHFFNF